MDTNSFQVLVSNLTNPTLLFFVLGIVAALLKSDLDWSILTPSFFSSENKSFSMLHGATLEKEEQIWG